jgi:hypothetical protein
VLSIRRRPEQVCGFHEAIEGIERHNDRVGCVASRNHGEIRIGDHFIDDFFQLISRIGKIHHAHRSASGKNYMSNCRYVLKVVGEGFKSIIGGEMPTALASWFCEGPYSVRNSSFSNSPGVTAATCAVDAGSFSWRGPS